MALIGATLSSLIFVNFSSKGFTGSKALELANSIGNGIVNAILESNTYTGTSSGVGPGSGVGTGFVTGIIGASVTSLIVASFLSRNISGTKSPDLASAVGEAFATHILSGQVTSTSVPVGIGTGTGTILGIVGSAVGASIQQMMILNGLTGTASLDLANGIGDGIATSLSAAIVTTVITGPVTYPISPMVGVDQGRLF